MSAWSRQVYFVGADIAEKEGEAEKEEKKEEKRERKRKKVKLNSCNFFSLQRGMLFLGSLHWAAVWISSLL